MMPLQYMRHWDVKSRLQLSSSAALWWAQPIGCEYPRWDSNPQSPPEEGGALSIRPHGHRLKPAQQQQSS